jgi:hypothetical protein
LRDTSTATRIGESPKDHVAEAARSLALNVAHYQQKYGALPFDDFAEFLRANNIDAETAEFSRGASFASRA